MAERAGRPSSIKEAPILTLWQARVFEAFAILSTERQIGMEEGPIPWSSVVAYADRNGFDADDLLYLIRNLDGAYLKFQRKKVTAHGNSKGTNDSPSKKRVPYSKRRN